MLVPSTHDTARMLVQRFFAGADAVQPPEELAWTERVLVRRCFELDRDEPVLAHVRWGAWALRPYERLLVTPSYLAWWRRPADRPHVLPWCEPAVADHCFASITGMVGPPFAVQRFYEAIQLLEPGEPLCDELEASIRADPENPDLRAVYLDWPGEFGHPRSLLTGLDPSDPRFRDVLRRHKGSSRVRYMYLRL